MSTPPPPPNLTITGRLLAVPALVAEAVTYDFYPGTNRYVYWLKQPLVVLVLAAAVSLVIGVTAVPQGYVVFGGLLAIILLGVCWPWIGMIGLRASLRFERPRTREGEPVTAVLTVHNQMPWPAWGFFLERGFCLEVNSLAKAALDQDKQTIALALARVPGFSQSEFRWEFVPRCRGDYPLQPPVLTTSFPFGLWQRSCNVEVTSRLLVWPLVVPLEALPLHQGQNFSLGALSDRRAGYEGDFIGTRQYRPGDLLRHVHWAQTARQGKMIVAERQANLTSVVRVSVDLDPGSHTRTGVNGSLEWALRVTASVCLALSQHDTRVLVELGDTLLAIDAGHLGQQRLNDTLARVQLSPTSPAAGQPKGLVRAVPRHRKAELQIVITSDVSRLSSARDSNPHVRMILLRWDESTKTNRDRATEPTRNPWIELHPGEDVPAQLIAQWRESSQQEWSHA